MAVDQTSRRDLVPIGSPAPIAPLRTCAVIPTFDNPRTITDVVERVRAHLPDVIVVDDGSGPAGRQRAEALHAAGLARVYHRPHNGGKGAAVKDGLQLAQALGFSHALQVDADGQHNLDDIPAMLARSAEQPSALILGAPQYDASAPRGRMIGRQITRFWTHLETGGNVIDDPMCGFRVYPVDAALAVRTPSSRMDFDIEIAVRMAWAHVPIVNVPTRVRYVPASAGGVSHFRMFRDNVRISWAHTRLVNLLIYRKTLGRLLRWLGGEPAKALS